MKICLVKTSSIGDISHSAFIPQLICKHIPNAVIYWYCDEKFTEIIKGNPYIEKIFPVLAKNANQNKWNFIKQLFQIRKKSTLEKYDIIIDLQGSFKSSLIAKALSCNKNLWGFKHTRDIFANKTYNYHSHIPLSANIYRRNFHLINDALKLNLQNDSLTKIINIPYIHTQVYNKSYNNPNSTRKHILIFPSSSKNEKNYDEKKYKELISKLKNYTVTLLYGSSAEKDICNEIAGNTGKIHIVGGYSLENVKGLLTKMDCIIGGDTGILHIASAIGVKNITLYGPTPSYRTSIHMAHSISLQGNGDVNKIPVQEILQSLKLLGI